MACCAEWHALPDSDEQLFAPGSDPWIQMRQLGEKMEPDLLLLAPDEDGQMRLLAGCVCFPSSWSLPEKLGKPMALIHDPTPGLNRTLGRQIDAFLANMRPGSAWLRSNWGLSASPELNQRPDRPVPRVTPELSMEEVWLRLERQALVSLPKSRGVLFGIRVESERLSELVKNAPATAAGLAQAIRTMPEDVAHYKGIATARNRILRQLEP